MKKGLSIIINFTQGYLNLTHTTFLHQRYSNVAHFDVLSVVSNFKLEEDSHIVNYSKCTN